MKAYNYQIMLCKEKKGELQEAKNQIHRHIDDYIRLVVGQAAEMGSAIPEVYNYFSSLEEVLVVTEKKNIPIIFEHDGVLLNLVGINRMYGYFLRITDEADKTRVPDKFKVTGYWFRENFQEIMKHMNASIRKIRIKDSIAYRLLKGQQEEGIVVSLTNESRNFNLKSKSIGERDRHECFGIKLDDLCLGHCIQ